MISKLISDVQFVIMIKVHPRFFFQYRDSLFIFSSQVPHHNFLSVHMISNFFISRVNMDEYLSSVYYDPKRPGGFGGVDRLYDDVKKEGKFAISRKTIKEWLMKQDAYTLHKPMPRHFKRNRVIVGGIDQQWQMDLADMQSRQKFNDGYRYLLVCIDVFSKYAWVVPLKNKTGPTLVEAFKVILSSGRKPEKIMTDQGTEFLNKHFRALMKEEDIELYNTYNETKASIV